MELNKTDDFPDGVTERYRTQVRMAECLSPTSIPICDFQSIIVKDEDDAKIVRQLFTQYRITNPPYINVRPNYF